MTSGAVCQEARKYVMKPVAILITIGLLAQSTFSLAPAGASVSHAAGAKTVGVVLFDSTDAFAREVGQGVQQEASRYGWKVDTLAAAGSVAETNNDIEDLVTRKVDAIVVTTVASTSLTAGLAQAKAANIPVISEDGGLAPGVSAAESNVNDASIGVLINDMFRMMQGKGSLLALTYTPGLPCKLRDDYLFSHLKAYPGIKMTRYELPPSNVPQAGKTAASTFLSAHAAGSGTLAIWGCYDDPTVGALSAVQSANRSGVQLYGYNGSPAALQAIKQGKFTATVYFDPVGIGQAVFGMLQKVMAAGVSWQPKVIPGPYILVDGKNITAFLKVHPGALKG